MSNKNTIRLLVLAASTFSGCAFAVDGMSIKLADGLEFTPSLAVSENYDDNFRELEKHAESSWITTISPSFALGAQGRKLSYGLAYTANSDTFHSDQHYNNTDHHFVADTQVRFDSRNRLDLEAAYHKVIDTSSKTVGQEGDKYNTKNIGGSYTYGADTATGQLVFGADYKELRYDNDGNLNAAKERDSTALTSTFFYRIGPKTRSLLELRSTDFDYLTATDLDATNLALLGGVTWQATALTSGTVKFGRERKSFDSNAHDDASGGMWEVGIAWEPLSYSTFGLKARRSLDEGEDGASAIRSTSSTLDWTHDWAPRISSTVSYTHIEQDYLDSAIGRLDKGDIFGVGLTYQMRRWLDVKLGYRYADNDSTAAGESYERNIYSIMFTGSL